MIWWSNTHGHAFVSITDKTQNVASSKRNTHTSHTRKDDGALTQKCLLIFNCDCECDRAEFLVVRRQFIKSTISSNATTNNYYYYYKQEIQISSWLRQELKKSQCGSVCPVLVCLKLSIFIFSAQIHLEDFRMTSGWLQDDFRMTSGWLRELKSTQWAIRKKESNQTLSYHWSLKYFVLLTRYSSNYLH